MGFPPNEVNQRFPAQVLRQRPGVRLVQPHQGRFDHEPALHPDIERHLKALDRIVAAIRVPGKVCFAHAADDAPNVQPVRKRGRHRQEQEVAPGNEGRRQARCGDLDPALGGQGRVHQARQKIQPHHAVRGERALPIRNGRQTLPDPGPALEFHRIALAVVEPDGIDILVAIQRPGQAGRGILTSRKEYQRSVGRRVTHVRKSACTAD